MKSYSYNNVTASPNEDGRVNCIPVSEGWNYVVRMYEPREEVINGIYKFPEEKEAN